MTEYLREKRSHIRADGQPKRCFEVFEEAEYERDRVNNQRGRDPRHFVGIYQCWMKPVHYHLGAEWADVPPRRERRP